MTITAHCNQRCPFCYMGWAAEPSHKSLEQVSQELAKARGLCHGKNIVLSGGEPTLHPKILDVLQLANNFGFTRVTLFTNGQRFHNGDLVNALVRGGLQSAMISLHGSSPEIYDPLVGKSHFGDVLEGIEKALGAGVEVIINTVATASNLEDIGSIYQLVQDRFPEVRSYRVTYPVACGELLRHPEIIPRYEAVTAVLSSLLGRSNRVPLACEVIPLCLLGSNLDIAVEYQYVRSTDLILADVAPYNRIGGKACLQCRFQDRCNGLQFHPVLYHGVPDSYGKFP